FSLLRLYVSRDLKRLKENGVRIRVIGSRNGLPEDVCGLIDKAQTETCDNSDFDLCIAFNYGGREEIVRAFAKLSGDIQAGRLDAASVNENLLASYLDTAGMPDPDLIIRTGGEMRLSNFLVWQATYSELLFSDILWPDYSASDLKAAIETYRTRARRFGGVLTEQI
ncbi:MAG: polyprenyl diphosphate synthase, partial [Henriciella sp.]